MEWLKLPIHLDMIGTAVAALALGPWRGALVGASTNIVGVAISGFISLPFALVNITGALVWGYGARRFGMGRSLPRFFVLCLYAAIACTVVAVPIIEIVYGGATGHGTDMLARNIQQMTPSSVLATGSANLLVSMADKIISGFIALVAVVALPTYLRKGLVLTGDDTASRMPIERQ